MSYNVGNIRIDTAKLDKMTAEARPKAHKIVGQYGALITASAVKRAPYDTGNLQNTISAESQFVGDMTFRIQDGTGYGVFQELGFVHWLSGKFIVHPFLIPAVMEYRQRFLNAFEELFK